MSSSLNNKQKQETGKAVSKYTNPNKQEITRTIIKVKTLRPLMDGPLKKSPKGHLEEAQL